MQADCLIFYFNLSIATYSRWHYISWQAAGEDGGKCCRWHNRHSVGICYEGGRNPCTTRTLR